MKGVDLQSNPFNTDTGGGGGIESVRINGVCPYKAGRILKNEWAFFPQGQSKLSVIIECPN